MRGGPLLKKKGGKSGKRPYRGDSCTVSCSWTNGKVITAVGAEKRRKKKGGAEVHKSEDGNK